MSFRNRLVVFAVAIPIAALLPSLLATQPAGAANIVFGAGTYAANTTTLKLTGTAVNVTGTVQGGVAVFTFGNVTIPSTAAIVASGSRPFELVSTGTLTLGGDIVSDGASATQNTAGPYAGGAGGGAGGTDGNAAGLGAGGGGHGSQIDNGGGGGGFASPGAPGGLDGSGTVGAAGKAYGNLNVALQGGSGGGGATTGLSAVGGGGGGGGIGLFAKTINIENTGGIIASGGSGSGGGDGASGGGSGGGILLHASTVLLNGILAAPGGEGGTGGCCGDGGGGAGGRVAVQFGTLSTASTLELVVVGGSSGTSGTYGHGETSADATGGAGVVTYTHIDASALSIGPSRSVHTGAATTVVTRLTDGGTGSGIPGATVDLYRRLVTGGPWKLAAVKTTTAGGQAVATVHVSASAQYEWRYAGALVHNPTTSPVESLLAT
jgi:hypothetical protein